MTEERFPPGRCTFVYSPEYYCDIGPHVFPTMKYRLVHRALLDAHLPGLLDAFRPELVVYLAGADPLQGDQLGGLDLTLDGLRQRDERVIGNCLRRRIPVAAVLGGGYARNAQDTVRAHHATCRAMWEAGKQIAECRHARFSPASGGSLLWRA